MFKILCLYIGNIWWAFGGEGSGSCGHQQNAGFQVREKIDVINFFFQKKFLPYCCPVLFELLKLESPESKAFPFPKQKIEANLVFYPNFGGFIMHWCRMYDRAKVPALTKVPVVFWFDWMILFFTNHSIKRLRLERLNVFFIGQPLVKSSVANPDLGSYGSICFWASLIRKGLFIGKQDSPSS